jgi:hypothetical protein
MTEVRVSVMGRGKLKVASPLSTFPYPSMEGDNLVISTKTRSIAECGPPTGRQAGRNLISKGLGINADIQF